MLFLNCDALSFVDVYSGRGKIYASMDEMSCMACYTLASVQLILLDFRMAACFQTVLC